MPKISTIILIALIAANPTQAWAQYAAPTQQGSFYGQPPAPPVTPYVNSYNENRSIGTAPLAAPTILPPALPARPNIPEPDSSCVLPPAAGNGIPKPSLGRRGKIVQANSDSRQATDSFIAKPSVIAQAPEINAALSHSYLAPLEDTLLALASACSMDNTIVESVDSSNGKLLARREGTGQTLRLTISAKEVSPNHTTVTLFSNAAASPLGKEILEKAAVLISGGGSL